MNNRKLVIKIGLVGITFFFFLIKIFPSNEICIKAAFYEGIRKIEGKKIGGTYFLKALFLKSLIPEYEPLKEKSTLKKIYNLQNVRLLSQSLWIWKNNKCNNQFQPILLNQHEFRIKIFKYKSKDTFRLEVSDTSKTKTKTKTRYLVNTEITLPIENTEFFGFEDSHQKFYFLSLHRVIPGNIDKVLVEETTQEKTNHLYFGSSKVDITPEKSVRLDGYPVERISEGVRDKLYCRVAIFKLGDEKLVLVSCDLIGFYRGTFEFMQEAIIKKFRLEPAEVFLTATHTHSGPVLTTKKKYANGNNYDYTLGLRDKILLAIEQAFNNSQKAKVGVDIGYSTVGTNRRVAKKKASQWPRDGGLLTMGRNPYGISDKEVVVVKVIDDNYEPVGCLFDYACHSRALVPRNKKISGDILGLSGQIVEKYIGTNIIAQVFSGASGDIDPGFYTNEIKGLPSELDLMANMLGVEVINVFRNINNSLKNNSIESFFYRIMLPQKKRKEYFTDNTMPKIDLNLTVSKVGDIAFIGLGCELLTEVGLAIKAGSPFKYNVIISSCNGASGYLPPKRLYKERGYEVSGSPFGPEAADMVVKQVLKMLYDLWE